MREDGIPSIEILMFDEHYMIKRAATEVMCNMILCEEVSVEQLYFGLLSICPFWSAQKNWFQLALSNQY